MPRRKPEKKLKPCRPLFQIDWNRVDKFLESGCPGTDIAKSLGCCTDTLYNRCMQEHGVGFSEYSAQKRSAGENLLRAAQMNLALKGNSSMLIWLGKNRLGQKDDPYQEVSFNGTLAQALDALKEMKKSTEK